MEIEAKFFDVDVKEVERRARELGCDIEETEQENYLIGTKKWLLRARKERNRMLVTLKYGLKTENNIKRVEEIEFEVCSNFDNVLRVLKFLSNDVGAKRGKYVKKVKRFELANAEVEIVFLEGFGSYIEIEGSEESIKKACELLGIDFSKRSAKTVRDLVKLTDW